MMRQFPVCLLAIGLLALPCSAATAEGIEEVRYSGVLSQPDRSGEPLILRKFEVLLLNTNDTTFFSVIDEGRDGSPWPESFGRWQAPNGPRPHLVYTYDGSAYTLPLPPLRLQLPDNVRSGSTWESNDWTFEAVDNTKNAAEALWNLTAKERRGRTQQLQVVAGSGMLFSATQDVFMGQGEQFELTMTRLTSAPVSDSVVQQTEQLMSELLTLQSKLERRSDSQQTELSPRQITHVKSQIDTLTALAKGTPLHETTLCISRDITRQGRRVDEAMKRQEELMNKPVPGFVLNRISGGVLESDSLAGKTVILHFWKYADKPLSEPYGQVAYLEFLYNKRKSANVEVVGVATNPSLQQEDGMRLAIRSAKKLTEFMNLSYPIGYDDGSLLRTLGDPRKNGGELPLWVVVSPAGKVLHYHSGYYEIDVREGLKQLDSLIPE